MLDWRYLTTIPDFLGQSACRFRGDLYLGGSWGPDGGLFGRETYAPLVRVGLDGGLSAPWEWPAPGSSTSALGYGRGVSALCEWRGDLFASGSRYVAGGVGQGNARLARYDGDVWTTEDTRQAFGLLGGQDHLFLSWQGGLAAWDGATAEIVAHTSGMHPQSLVEWQGRIAFLGNSPQVMGSPKLFLVSRERDSWRVEEAPHPVSARFGMLAGSGWWAGDFRLAAFRGGLWACEWATEDGDNAYYLSSFTGSGWERWMHVHRGQPFTLANLRNRLYLYEGSEDIITDASSWNPFDGTYYQGLYDGTTLSGLADCEVVPYQVIGLGDGAAVALCRSRARMDYVRELLLAGAYVSPDVWQPDADTLVYVTWPSQPGPVIVPAGDLAGTVTNTTPTALENADVVTGDLSDLTDAAGDYGIADIIVGRHTAHAVHDGYYPGIAEVRIAAEATTDQDFSLQGMSNGECCLWGFVRDGVTGVALAGAPLVIDEGTGDETTFPTDGNGSWAYGGSIIGAHTVRATCAGYEDSGVQAATLAEGDVVRMDFYLFADDGGSVAGFVRDIADGAPLNGSFLTLTAGGVEYLACTDAGGYYSRAGMPAGTYDVTVTMDGYQDRTGTVVVESGQCTRADWSLAAVGVAVGALRVTVTDADTDAALVGAVVTLPRIARVVTGADGTATIGGLPAGDYRVLVEAVGYYPAGDAATVTASATTELAVELDPVPAGTQTGWLFGFVSDTDALPIAGATVSVAGDAAPGNAQDATTDAAGYYLVTGLLAGTETVTVDAAGYQDGEAANVPLSAGIGTRLDFALLSTGSDSGSLMGYLVDACDLSAVEAAQVWLDGLSCVYSDTAGHYYFATVAAETHELEGFAAGFYPGHVGDVPVADGETTECDLALFRIARLGTCIVTVLDEAGATVDGAEVALSPWIGGVTGAEGTCTLENVPEGIYEALACADGYLPGHATVQVPAAGVGAVTVTVTAQEEGDTDGVLVGYVADQYTRHGIIRARVEAAGTATETTTAGAGGYYALSLTADTYDVTGSADDYRSRVYPDVAVVSREVTRQDLFLLPGSEAAGVYFVGVPEQCEAVTDETGVPLGGAGEVCVEWPEDASSWEIAVAVDEAAASAAGLFRRGQRVQRGARVALERQGGEVRIVGRQTSGDIGGVGVQFWPV